MSSLQSCRHAYPLDGAIPTILVVSSSGRRPLSIYTGRIRVRRVPTDFPHFSLTFIRQSSGSNLTVEFLLGFPFFAARASLRDAHGKNHVRFARANPRLASGAGKNGSSKKASTACFATRRGPRASSRRARCRPVARRSPRRAHPLNRRLGWRRRGSRRRFRPTNLARPWFPAAPGSPVQALERPALRASRIPALIEQKRLAHIEVRFDPGFVLRERSGGVATRRKLKRLIRRAVSR